MTPSPSERLDQDGSASSGGRSMRCRIGRRGFLGFLLALGLGGLPGFGAGRTRVRGGWILREDDR